MPKLPKSWRPQPTKEEIFRETWAATNKIIRKAMIEQGVRYDKTLGEMIGLEKHMVSKSMNLKRPWTFCELCDIVSALKIPGEDAARMLGFGR